MSNPESITKEDPQENCEDISITISKKTTIWETGLCGASENGEIPWESVL